MEDYAGLGSFCFLKSGKCKIFLAFLPRADSHQFHCWLSSSETVTHLICLAHRLVSPSHTTFTPVSVTSRCKPIDGCAERSIILQSAFSLPRYSPHAASTCATVALGADRTEELQQQSCNSFRCTTAIRIWSFSIQFRVNG